MHFYGRFVIRGLELATNNLSTKFEVFNSTHYEDMKNDTKYRKWGDLGGYGNSMLVEMAPFNRAHTSSY